MGRRVATATTPKTRTCSSALDMGWLLAAAEATKDGYEYGAVAAPDGALIGAYVQTPPRRLVTKNGPGGLRDSGKAPAFNPPPMPPAEPFPVQ
jgi:hypothetical protein